MLYYLAQHLDDKSDVIVVMFIYLLIFRLRDDVGENEGGGAFCICLIDRPELEKDINGRRITIGLACGFASL